MKHIVFVVMLLGLMSACRLSDKNEHGELTTDIIKNPKATNADDESVAAITFENSKIDFGTLVQGERFDTTIVFTNTGDEPLLIQSIKGSCGCTVPREWPKELIKPGDKAQFKVSFNSEGKQGQQHNTVTVVANTYPATTVVVLHGKVLKPNQK